MSLRSARPSTLSLWCALGLLALLLAGMPPVAMPADQKKPRLSPVRRTTIATADLQASLRFYRDLLGFEVEYDRPVTDPQTLGLFAPGATEGRAVALRQGAGLGGSIGLFHAPGVAMPPGCRTTASAGSVAMLILTDDLPGLRDRLKAAGVTFLTQTVSYSEGRGPTDAFTVFDPNCVRVAFAQIRTETLEEAVAR